jgi:hypothetical protein
MCVTEGKVVGLLAAIVFLAFAATVNIGCDDQGQEEPSYYFHVYRENLDGTHTRWTLTEVPSTKGAFVCWGAETPSKLMCISGAITVIPRKIEQPTVPKESAQSEAVKEGE